MISRLGLRISAVFRAIVPDPFVLVVLLSLVTALLALTLGDFPATPARPSIPETLPEKAWVLLDAWRGDEGLWKFLAFGMQMSLILVTGHALAATRPVRRLIALLVGLPASTAGAAAMIGVVACLTALLNWGLGLIVGALLAREAGRSLSARGVRAHYPLLAAAGYMGLLIWHGGLSGSAPLSMTTIENAQRVLPKDFLAANADRVLVSLAGTTFSPLNGFVTLGLLAIIPTMLALLAPRGRDAAHVLPIEDFAGPASLPGGPSQEAILSEPPERDTVPDRLDRSPILAWLVAVPLLLALVRFAVTRGLGNIGLNEINTAMLALGLLLHGSLRGYAEAAEEGARDAAGVILQFPLYGGILAMLSASGLVRLFAQEMADLATPTTLPLFTFLAASILNLFITSGGGLWGVQGPIALESGLALGVDPGTMVMSVAYGDQLTNMLQPFWALPLLAITGVKARDIVGYTAIVMLAAAVWIALGLLIF